MIYWKYSQNRVFFLNEYWILIPIAVLVDYVIIRKIHSRKERIKQLKQLLDQIEREKKIRRILYLSLGLNVYSCILLTRGGQDLINVDYIRDKCSIEEGVRFLDDKRLRKIIQNLYSHKRKGQIIYITATALCHIASTYGQKFLALPFAMGDFGLTSVFQTIRKAFVTLLLGMVGPLYILDGPISLTFAVICGVLGLKLAVVRLDLIATSPVYDLKPRIPYELDIVVLNSENSHDKIIMSNPVQEKKECWLGDQALTNPNCKIKPTQIPDAIDLVSPDLKYDQVVIKYDQVVTMKDTTGLTREDFADVFDLGQPEPGIPKRQKGKMVNFLEKFGDSGSIDEKDTWDISESKIPEKKYLRTRNEL